MSKPNFQKMNQDPSFGPWIVSLKKMNQNQICELEIHAEQTAESTKKKKTNKPFFIEGQKEATVIKKKTHFVYDVGLVKYWRLIGSGGCV